MPKKARDTATLSYLMGNGGTILVFRLPQKIITEIAESAET